MPRHFPEFGRGQTEDLNDPSSRILGPREKKRAPGVPGPQCRPDPDLALAPLWLPHSLGVRVRVRCGSGRFAETLGQRVYSPRARAHTQKRYPAAAGG